MLENSTLTHYAQQFLDAVPFNTIMQLRLVEITLERVVTEFSMQDQLVGNKAIGSLHGGVIGSVLDTTGGIIALANTLDKMAALSQPEQTKKFTRFGTIDMRVDYLRPGRGKVFTCSAEILRAGRSVSVTRMELHNDKNSLIAAGIGTYTV